ncbi:MAG: NRDE family protein [Kiritimatiellia bacterium]
MCTVSWWRREGRLSLRFNRDEQRNRPPAELPRRCGDLICPRDPQGGGTWIAVDPAGTVHCLLNFYGSDPAAVPPQPRSRGELPLLSAGNPEPVRSWLQPQAYPPFHLLRIPRSGCVTHVCWDGRRLFDAPAHPEITHWTTSGWNSEAVVRARGLLFQQILEEQGLSESALHAFHTSTHAEDPGRWPCMRRPDAQTVSISEILIDEQRILFRYTPITDQGMHPPHECDQPLQIR